MPGPGAEAKRVACSLASMSNLTYVRPMAESSETGRVLVWLGGEVKTPPLSAEARVEAGFLLRQLQSGALLAMPHSRPMTSIGPRCHELRVVDAKRTWRVMYRIDPDAIVILEVFGKTSQATPKRVIETCKERLRRYDQAAGGTK